MSPIISRPLPGERQVSYSATWFAPVDMVTGSAPELPLTVLLDIQVGQTWAPTGIKPTVTLSGAISYPDLGRCRDPGTTAPRRYRARFEPGIYLATVRAYQDGEEFLALPFNDTTPPAAAVSPLAIYLVPAPGYPFSSEVPAVYGQVSTAAGEPVPNVLLSATVGLPALRTPQIARTLTGPRGTFALPLRWALAGQQITVVADDYRHVPTRTGQLTVQLPDAFGRNQNIVIG